MHLGAMGQEQVPGFFTLRDHNYLHLSNCKLGYRDGSGLNPKGSAKICSQWYLELRETDDKGGRCEQERPKANSPLAAPL